jgi:hypothetical protein
MADGLDTAAQAFQQAIGPTVTPPRDTGGRFTSVQRPEAMFEPRPVEGDELTGDTRDAGDDPRLSAMERRVADGRAEEGDEEFHDRRRSRVSSAAARAEPAAGDDRYGVQETLKAEQRPGEPEHEVQDGEGRDGGPEGFDKDSAEGERRDAEGDAQRDAEAGSEFKVTLDGQPVDRFEVTIDGKPTEVSLGEALRGYIREKTFHQRMNEVGQARQVIQGEAQNLVSARDAYIAKLQYADRLIASMTPQEPDWDAEFQRDPRAAHERQKAYGAIYQQRQMIDSELRRTAQEQQAAYDQRSQEYAVTQFTRFVVDANIPDEPSLNKDLGMMRSYGRMRGFSEAELATTYDSRMLAVLRDAALYNQLTTNRPRPVAHLPGKGRTLTPGTATPIGNATRRLIDDAQGKLAKTGRLDDAASVMARLIR